MQTLYIDVYFLINFTVDFLALYFSTVFSKVPTTAKRLVIASLVGALAASFMIFLPEVPALKLLCSTATLTLCAFLAIKKVSVKRRVRFLIAFLVFEAISGGCVSFLWGIFDKYFYSAFSSMETVPVNRKLLLFSVIVLIFIGVFKMIVSFFSNIAYEGAAKIEISLFDKKITAEAFIDSGNLAVDPMDMQPILFVKEELAREFIPEAIVELRDPDVLDRNARKKIRLIPVSRGDITHVLTGVKPDCVKIIDGEKEEIISVTVAIDKEKGNYGGYLALIPSGVVSDAKI